MGIYLCNNIHNVISVNHKLLFLKFACCFLVTQCTAHCSIVSFLFGEIVIVCDVKKTLPATNYHKRTIKTDCGNGSLLNGKNKLNVIAGVRGRSVGVGRRP